MTAINVNLFHAAATGQTNELTTARGSKRLIILTGTLSVNGWFIQSSVGAVTEI